MIRRATTVIICKADRPAAERMAEAVRIGTARGRE